MVRAGTFPTSCRFVSARVVRAEPLGDVARLDDQLAAHLAVVDLRPDAAGIGKQGGAGGAHLLQLAQAALVAPPARRHAAQQPARFIPQPAVEALGFARLFVQHLLAPVVKRAETLAGLGAAGPFRATGCCW